MFGGEAHIYYAGITVSICRSTRLTALFSGAFSLFNTFANVRSSEYQNAKIAQKPAVIGREAVLPLSASSVRTAPAEEYIKFFLSLAKTIAAEYNIFGICMPIPGVSGYI